MGIGQRLNEMNARATERSNTMAAGRQRTQERLVATRPDHGGHYDVEVNKGSFNSRHMTALLNKRYEMGWEIDKMFEQDGNTVLVFVRAR